MAWPFAIYAGWSLILLARLGYLPTDAAGTRAGAPGAGLIEALDTTESRLQLGMWVVLGLTMCCIGIAFVRRDVLTWIVTGYVIFASTLAPVVWATRAGFTRALLPLYGFGLIVTVAGIQRVRARARDDVVTRRDYEMPRIGARNRPV